MIQSQPEHLIKMVNQIAANNLHHGDIDEAAGMVCGHLQKFWARPMKQQIIGYLQEGGPDLSDTARRAVEMLANRA